jgi:4-hydroxy-tetrahydrodipicolinate synthase
MQAGTYTAIITPFTDGDIDHRGLERLVEFQIRNGIHGILAVGTTGESPALTWTEHNRVIETVAGLCRGRCLAIAGTGSNNTQEALEATAFARDAGADAVLLVDPYYNGPSSLEIRREYIEPIARQFPDLDIIPYVIPGRTGTQLLPEDLAIAARNCPNVATVKEATGSLDNMRRTRACCGPDFTILSGDDALTYDMMTDPAIGAAGVISVISNLAPGPISRMVQLLQQGDLAAAAKLRRSLDPLFQMVTVKTTEATPHGPAVCRSRNPVPIKTLMAILGMPAGICRPPLGRMTPQGLAQVLAVGRQVHAEAPEIFAPVAEFFGVDVAARLNAPDAGRAFCYTAY